MIPNELDDSIDDVLQRVPGSPESRWDAWLRQAPREFVSDPESSQYARESFRLADAFHRMPRPAPRTDFADRVIAALAATPPRWTAPRYSLRIAATVLYAAAAVVFAAVALVFRPAHEPAPRASDDAPTPDVAVAIREGAAAYAELVQALADAAAVAPASTALVADEERWAAATSPVGMAVRGSTKSMQNARHELQATVEPVAMSALDAFGFLWKPAKAPPSDPST
jgi:hypothetical protein